MTYKEADQKSWQLPSPDFIGNPEELAEKHKTRRLMGPPGEFEEYIKRDPTHAYRRKLTLLKTQLLEEQKHPTKNFQVINDLKKEISEMKKHKPLASISNDLRVCACFVFAKLNGTYDFSSLQVQFPEKLAKEVIAWGKKNIPEENLHNNKKDTKGLEDDIHITAIYGVTNPEPDEIRDIITSTEPFKIKLGLVTLFDNKPDYDVVKIDAESPDLTELHYRIRKSVEVKNDYPVYKAHCTIGYVKKGTADNLNGSDFFKGKNFIVDEIIFSSLNGDKIPIKLNKGE